ncbi:MAG: exosortase-associated EpsI family protein [Candidatus Didemnitutus sp.]|nr:exosortase-associated EpsI family protein [Candidatus Didemnitutus sp.]
MTHLAPAFAPAWFRRPVPLITALLAVIVLLGAVALQFVNVRDVKEGDRGAAVQPIGLAQAMPKTLPGWVGHDEPLGPNEVVQTAVERVLNYDDYVFRVFRRGDLTLGVYVAYWAAGRMPVQKVASHTPDRCWSENGWRCLDMRFAEPVVAGELRLQPAQWRIFQPPSHSGGKEYVLFWHLVGDKLHEYGDRFNDRPELVSWWRDTLAFAFSGSAPQYFIRITSNGPFERLVGEPGWTELVEALAQLGLQQAPVAPAP